MSSLCVTSLVLLAGTAHGASPCFGGADVGLAFSQVSDGKLNIVNAAPMEMWVHAEQNPTGAGGWSLERWRDALAANGFDHYFYQDYLPDGTRSAFNINFKLDPFSDSGNLLDFAGASLRATAMLACVQNDPGNPAAGRAGLTCQVSSGGTPSPQTLFEWTIPGVMDSSFVDGYGVPMKVQSNNNDPRGDTVFGQMMPDKCPYKILDASGHYLGCQSPCSAGVGSGSSPTDPQSNDAACCRGAFDTPQACNIGGIGGGAQNDKTREWCSAVTTMCENDGQRVGYCFAYDDGAGTFSLGSKAKATFCGDGYEWLFPAPSPGPPSPAPPSPAPPSPAPSNCPGGSLAACMDMCPTSPAVVYQVCVKTCLDRCPSTVV